MKRIPILILVLLLCLSACAEGYLQGGEGGSVGEWTYVSIPSGSGNLLVCLREGNIFAAEQADGIESIVSDGERIWYLRLNGTAWELVRRDAYRTEVLFTFEAGEKVSDLCIVGDNFFVLKEGRICVLYPESGLCLQMANVAMDAYTIRGDYAYYISHENRSTHELKDLEGNSACAEGGQLWRLNLTTAAESCVLEEGITDLTMYGDVLYFHDLADAYLCGTGDACELKGHLWSIDLTTGVKHRMTARYDWSYQPVNGQMLLLGEEGLIDAETGETVCAADTGARLILAGSAAVLFEAEQFEFTVLNGEGKKTRYER